MADPNDNTNSTEQLLHELNDLQKKQQEQADIVRKLKNDKASKDQIDAAVTVLQQLKSQIVKLDQVINPPKAVFNRNSFARLMTQRFFYTASFEIYGGNQNHFSELTQ